MLFVCRFQQITYYAITNHSKRTIENVDKTVSQIKLFFRKGKKRNNDRSFCITFAKRFVRI